MTKAHFPRQYTGVRAKTPPNLVKAKVNPLSTNTAFIIGDLWINTVLNTSYQWSGTEWIELGSGSVGAIFSITGDTGGAEIPSGGNFSLLGTANQITVTGGTNKETFSLPTALTVPGSLTTTTTLTATLGAITATNGNVVMGTIGNKVIIPTGTNAAAGVSGNMSGTPGAVTVATTSSSTTALILYSRKTTGGTPGQVSITAQDGTGFTLTSTGNESSTFNWVIFNA